MQKSGKEEMKETNNVEAQKDESLVNEKKKNGFKIFFETIKEFFFPLIGLNVLFVLVCIPIITIGPAVTALEKVTMDMVRQKSYTPVSEFFTEFKKNFFIRASIGLAIIVVALGMVYSIIFHIQLYKDDIKYIIIAVISVVALLYFLAVIMYILKLQTCIELPAKAIRKNAMLLVILSPLEMLLIVVVLLLPLYFFIVVWSIGVPVVVLFEFSFGSLITSTLCWKVIHKYVVMPEEKER